jgi:uncharacterized membrane protein YfcA
MERVLARIVAWRPQGVARCAVLDALLICLVIGAFAGFAAGMFGIGGGLLMVPALAWLLPRFGVPDQAAVHVAVGTSLVTIALGSLASVRAHHARGAVRWDQWRLLAPALAIGGASGALAARWLPGDALAAVFAGVSLGIALWFARGAPPLARAPSDALARTLALGIGVIAALSGVGGGLMVLPLLVARGVALHSAVGTSSAITLPVAVTAGAIYAFGPTDPELAASGAVLWSAVAALAFAAWVAAPWGAALAHRLPAADLRAAFALLAAAGGGSLLLR